MSKNIVLTGASSEIGMAILKQIYNPENKYILQCFKSSATLKNFITANSYNVEIVELDLTDRNLLNDFCKKIEQTDSLVHIAAVTKTDLLPNLSDEVIEQMLAVNIFALTKITRSVLPYMISRRSGNTVFISSVAASRGNKGQSVYGGTKAYIESFARTLASEFASRGLKFNCVAPGAIDAGSLKELLAYAKKEVLESVASGKLGTPEDVAGLVKFLLSDSSKFINGKTIAVDGGFLKGV